MATTVALKRVPHTITVGAAKVGVILPDEYGGLGTILGVDKLTTSNKPELSSTSNDLVRSGQALKIKVSFAIGTKRRTAYLLCDIDKVKTAVTELVGKSFRGSTIKTAYFPRRARYS
jgi:hypothetical protein